MKIFLQTSLSFFMLITCLPTASIADDSKIEYPHNYREWTHVKSMVIQHGHPLHASFGGIHHIYANDKALQGYINGIFPEGSIIIFDLLAEKASDNAITEGSRKVLGVMEKDNTRFKETSGWGFEGFANGKASDRVVGNNYKEACYACHTTRENNDYVFSVWRK